MDFSRTKPHVNIGTIGHGNHGKTTLTAAITKILTDKGRAKYMKYDDIHNAPVEKAGGIAVNVARVEYETDSRHYGHIDWPGHADYIKSIVAGTVQLDGGILVVAATDGPVPQTGEHLLLAKQVGVENLVVYMNKADAVDDKEKLKLVELEIRKIIAQYGYNSSNTPVVIGSALCAIEDKDKDLGFNSIHKLLEAIDSHIPTPKGVLDKPFLLPVEDTFSISGRGAVVTGRAERGMISIGDTVEIIGLEKTITTVVTGLEVFRKQLAQAQAGDNLGVIMRGVEKEDLKRGMTLCAPGSIRSYSKFEAQVYMFNKDEGGNQTPFNSTFKLQICVRTADIAAIVSLPEGTTSLMPGENSRINMELLFPLPIEICTRFTLHEGSRTIGTGVVIKLIA